MMRMPACALALAALAGATACDAERVRLVALSRVGNRFALRAFEVEADGRLATPGASLALPSVPSVEGPFQASPRGPLYLVESVYQGGWRRSLSAYAVEERLDPVLQDRVELAAIAGVDTGEGRVALHPSGLVLYQTAGSELYGYRIATEPGLSASLMPGPLTSRADRRYPRTGRLAFSASGRFLWQQAYGTYKEGGVVTYAVDAASGALQFIGSVRAYDQGSNFVVDAHERFAFVAAGSSWNSFGIAPASGKLNPIGQVRTGRYSSRLVAASSPGWIFAAGGELTSVEVTPSGVPVPRDTAPISTESLVQDRQLLYAGGRGALRAYRFDERTGGLALVQELTLPADEAVAALRIVRR